MKIFDISQEVFGCTVFPGDCGPERNVVETIDGGSICNLTALSMCAHNGTHVDAPYHFYNDGKTIDQLDMNKLVGLCYVSFAEGEVTEEKAREILVKACQAKEESAKKILIGGDCFISLEAAKVFAEAKVDLIGNESQTVGPMEGPSAVHYELLKEEIVLLEGIRLGEVSEGVYFLNAMPLNLGGSDGAPCRAILIGECPQI